MQEKTSARFENIERYVLYGIFFYSSTKSGCGNVNNS